MKDFIEVPVYGFNGTPFLIQAQKAALNVEEMLMFYEKRGDVPEEDARNMVSIIMKNGTEIVADMPYEELVMKLQNTKAAICWT